MPTPISLPCLTIRNCWEAVLFEFGFQSRGGHYAHDDFTFRLDDQWLRVDRLLSRKAAREALSLDDLALWKGGLDGQDDRRVFESPAALIEADEAESDDSEPQLTFRSWLGWALSTGRGQIPPGWAPPSPAQLGEWAPSEALNLRQGVFVRQGEWLVSPSRLALQFPIVFEVPADLPPSRAAWLQVLLAEANERWRLVRFGLQRAGARTSLVARVDFTGAPHSRRLFSTSLEALKYGTAWLIESAELLADTSLALQALAAPPPHNQHRKEQHYERAIR
jgi:hypothetical protein